jgi:hypothetical protein
MIQSVEQYLRHYLDWNQDNWVELLPMAQYAMNNAKNATTGITPHFANLGRNPRMNWRILPAEGRSESALMQVSHLDVLHQSIAKDIRWAEEKMKFYYDKKREDTPQLEEGERVYLLRRTMGQKKFNIKSKRPSNKLDAVKYGPFRIDKILKNDNYRLKLPARMRIHPVFHVSLLEPTKNPENAKDEAEDEEYEVEKILGRESVNGEIYYLVNWKGYPPEENTWEPVRHLNCQEKIQEYHQATGKGQPTVKGRQLKNQKVKKRPRQADHRQ